MFVGGRGKDGDVLKGEGQVCRAGGREILKLLLKIWNLTRPF